MARQPSGDPGRRGSMLQSLQRGTAVLDALAASSAPLSAGALAADLTLDRTVVHRILRTLEHEELVVAAAGRYGLGPRALLLGNSFLRHNPLRRASLPYQVDLLHRGFAGRPWALSVLAPVGNEMTLVTQLWSPTAPLDSLLTVPDRLMIEQTAAGRCVLAALADDDVVRRIGADAADALRERLGLVRAAGFVDLVAPQERGNAPAGVAALSALIRSRAGEPVAGLTVSGTELEAHLSRDSDVALRLRRAAEQIGQLVT